MPITADSPLALRVVGYLAERFPPVVYTLLVVLFFGSAKAVAEALGGPGIGPVSWVGAVVAELVGWPVVSVVSVDSKVGKPNFP
jgi:hypothetical protein